MAGSATLPLSVIRLATIRVYMVRKAIVTNVPGTVRDFARQLFNYIPTCKGVGTVISCTTPGMQYVPLQFSVRVHSSYDDPCAIIRLYLVVTHLKLLTC